MIENLFLQAGIVCPECRKPAPGGMIAHELEIKTIQSEAEGNVLTGTLACTGCGIIYPIIGGIPCVLRDVRGWLEQELMATPLDLELPNGFSRPVKKHQHRTPEAERALVSAFGEFHYGEFSGRADAHLTGNRDYWEKVLGMAGNAPFLDLGCSVGRFTFESAKITGSAVGLDIRLSVLASAEKFRSEGKITIERRIAGRRFDSLETSFSPPANVLFIAADALDPPFGPGSFGTVASLNLLDNVPAPLVLLGQMDALLRPAGTLLLGSPYEWREDITHPSEWLDTADMDSAIVLKDLLIGNKMPGTGFNYSIEQEIPELEWTMRNHDRYYSRFISHIVKARKKAR